MTWTAILLTNWSGCISPDWFSFKFCCVLFYFIIYHVFCNPCDLSYCGKNQLHTNWIGGTVFFFWLKEVIEFLKCRIHCFWGLYLSIFGTHHQDIMSVIVQSPPPPLFLFLVSPRSFHGSANLKLLDYRPEKGVYRETIHPPRSHIKFVSAHYNILSSFLDSGVTTKPQTTAWRVTRESDRHVNETALLKIKYLSSLYNNHRQQIAILTIQIWI